MVQLSAHLLNTEKSSTKSYKEIDKYRKLVVMIKEIVKKRVTQPGPYA